MRIQREHRAIQQYLLRFLARGVKHEFGAALALNSRSLVNHGPARRRGAQINDGWARRVGDSHLGLILENVRD